jgi:RNase P/RNase MRP subunit p29
MIVFFLLKKCFSLSEKSLQEAARRLMNADLHGAILRVTRSKCPSLVGATGILLQETKNSFLLVTVNNRLKSKYLSSLAVKSTVQKLLFF